MSSNIVARAVRFARNPVPSLNWRLKKVTRGVNRRFKKAAGGDKRPVFYDIDATLPVFRLLDRNYAVIREEMESVLNYKERIPRYHELDRGESYISGSDDPTKNWRVFMLESVAGTPKENQDRCPRTMALVRQIPNLYQAFFSMLDPGKSIPAHNGNYFGYLRYHLGLRVPKNNPPTMRVKDQFHTWQEGQSLLFDDSWNHEVMNKSDDMRVVLIVDVLRPLPFHLHAANWVMTRVLMRHSEEAQQVMANIKKYSQTSAGAARA
jgi:aspartyl/asparaginyl beta-hydroxylase (cupin superfamily)